ncbi:MAG: YCF48-related protein [Candidatus Eisenbacteria bacterium]
MRQARSTNPRPGPLEAKRLRAALAAAHSCARFVVCLFACAAVVLLSSPGEAHASGTSGPDSDGARAGATEALLLAIAASPAGDALLAVGEHGTILRRESGEDAWAHVDSPTDVLLTCVTFADESRAWAGGHDATLLASTDAGRTWSVRESDPEAEAPFLSLWFEDADHGFALGAYGLALETLDGGETWEERDLAEEGPHLYGITATPDDSVFVAGEFGTILRSGDGGETWTPLDSPYAGTFFGTLALSDGSVLVYGLRGNVYRSEDAGASWSKVDVDDSASLLTGLELPDGTVLLTGLAGSRLESHDGGRSFQARNREDRLALTGLVFSGGAVWASSEHGMVPLGSNAERRGNTDAKGGSR